MTVAPGHRPRCDIITADVSRLVWGYYAPDLPVTGPYSSSMDTVEKSTNYYSVDRTRVEWFLAECILLRAGSRGYS